MIFKELILQGHVGLAVVGVLASLVSVYYYLAVPVALFLDKPSGQQQREAAERPAVLAPLAGATVLVCGFLVLVLGLMPGHGHWTVSPAGWYRMSALILQR